MFDCESTWMTLIKLSKVVMKNLVSVLSLSALLRHQVVAAAPSCFARRCEPWQQEGLVCFGLTTTTGSYQ